MITKKSHLDNFLSGDAKSAKHENIFDEDDVERYDADTYRKKYGDRWKKLASSVRDVVQPDGTIIREYVIEDPTLLEQLSEDEENINSFNIKNSNSSNDKLKTTIETNNNLIKTQNSLFSNKAGQKSCINFTNDFLKSPSHGYNMPNATFEINQMNNKYNNNNMNESKSKLNSPVKTSSNIFQPIKSLNEHVKSPILNEVNGKIGKEEEDVDKEVETIHEQGKQLKQLGQSYDQTDVQNDNSIIEYEVLDEHGNQILINGADQLKKLAACVNEIKQSDGSIVKEYILNDPQVIEQIRNQIKTKVQNSPSKSNIFPINKLNPTPPIKQTIPTENNNNNNNIDRFSPLPSLASTLTSSTPYISQVQQQIQKFQKQQNQPIKKPEPPVVNNFSKLANIKSDLFPTPPPAPPPPVPLKQEEKNSSDLFKQINRNKFELKTSKGKSLQFTITSDDPSESDIEEVKSLLNKKLNSSTENSSSSNYFFQPKPLNNQLNHSNILKCGSMDNILAPSKPAPVTEGYYKMNTNKSTVPVYLNYLNHAKSIANLNSNPKTKSTVNLSKTEPTEKPKINNCTYTKSTFNLKTPLLDSALDQINKKPKSLENNSNKKLNKSLDNLDKIDKSTADITPEMTEQLLLKLLLHQISLQKPQDEDDLGDDEQTSFSNDTMSNSQSPRPKVQYIQSHSHLPHTPLASNVASNNSTINRVRNKLYQKSMSNFERMEETETDDGDDYEETNFRAKSSRFQNVHKKSYKNYF